MNTALLAVAALSALASLGFAAWTWLTTADLGDELLNLIGLDEADIDPR